MFLHGVIADDVGSFCGVNIWTISFLGGVKFILKKSVVLCLVFLGGVLVMFWT